MTWEEEQQCGKDYIVACVVATEVPPNAPEEEFKAVIDVMRNRAASDEFGTEHDLVQVVLQRNQFSAVCRAQYWRDAMSGKWLKWHVAKCFDLIRQQWDDTTDGATHYYSPISMEPKDSVPSWAGSMTRCEVEGVRDEYFRFYK